MVRKAESLAIVALAVTGLITFGPGQASAGHVSCGDTITVDTTLDSDLVDCPNNGIVIGADNITLDLNGHLVDGDDTPVVGCPFCDLGLFNEGHDGVTVRDGSVNDGVYLYAQSSRTQHIATACWGSTRRGKSSSSATET